ncbi:MAG: ABC transporter substrate-binding protein, partial [Dehalococcoidia bacterium]|nr:ABC transporter substrate-binding protein [Dehalococcoidia bacterium]
YGQTWATAVYDLQAEYGLKMDKIALAGDSLKTIQDLYQGARDVIKAKGDEGKVVADITFDAAAIDLTPVAAKLKAASPDILYGPAYFGSAMVLLRSMDAVGYYPPLQVLTDSLVSPKALDALGKDLAIKMTRRPGILFNAYFNDKSPLPHIQDFVARAQPWMKSKGFAALEVDFVMGAQAMLLAQKALEMAGSTDPKVINAAFHNLKVPQTDPAFIVSAYAPEIAWEPNGRAVNANFLMSQWQQKSGQWGVEVIWPKSLRTAEFQFPPEAKK